MKRDIPISVLMPVYNAEKYLPEAIESILDQTYTNFEFLIVENGSNDRSREIIKHFAILDRRIRPFFLEKKGFANAINFGAKEAKYDWIARMDADDISLPERLEVQVKYIEKNTPLSAVGSYGYYVSADGKKILGKIRIGPVNRDQYKRLVRKNKLIFLLNVSAIIHRQTYLELGGYREIPILEDLDFNCRLADKGELILVIPQPLVKVRKIHSSETSSKFFLLQNTMRWIKYATIKRREGKPEPSVEEFFDILERDPFSAKFNRYRQDYGAFFLKKSGLALSYKNYIQFLFFSALSFLTTPEYFLSKVKTTLF